MTPTKVLGLDVGGTKCAAVVGSADDGTVLDRVEWPSQTERGPDAMIDDFVREARRLLSRHAHVASVGISIGGPLDTEHGIIYSPPNLAGWDGVPLKDRIAHALHLPVAVEHDGAACALAEHRWGAGKGSHRLIYLTCGTGFGMGMVIDGVSYRGAGGRPSDIGHVHYRDDGPEAYGRRGTLEAFCSGTALTKLAAWHAPERWSASPPTPQEISALASTGDADALAVLAINATAVGDACAMLADLLYPDRILIGSLARYLGEAWLTQVRDRFTNRVYPAAGALCEILPAGLGTRLQDCSALAAAPRQSEKPVDKMPLRVRT